MTFAVPRDLIGYKEVHRLVNSLGEIRAFAAIFILFTELAYQVDEHGNPGFLAESDISWVREKMGVKTWDYVLKSGLVQPRKDGMFCQVFAISNRAMDWNYWSVGFHWGKVADWRFQKTNLKNGKDVREMASIILGRSDGFLAEGEKIDIGMSQRIVLLIRSIDLVMGRKLRQSDEFSDGLLRSAFMACCKYSQSRIDVILDALYLRRKNYKVSRNSDQLILDFDNMVDVVYPEQGWQNFRDEIYAEEENRC